MTTHRALSYCAAHCRWNLPGQCHRALPAGFWQIPNLSRADLSKECERYEGFPDIGELALSFGRVNSRRVFAEIPKMRLPDERKVTGSLPESYQDADWRNATPVDARRVRLGLSFNIKDEVIRLALPPENARSMAEALAEFLDAYEGRNFHSDKSSAIPSMDGSTPEEGQKV
ncbi:hypothetical protein [Methylohalobius crimeensis]|uniref:hypothetical protein n=1 Tax=Methylohalobius crimeensis TaxID=244365 RepID=UPI0003B38B73|nr:hypothetical protein [Methylohalobius crimeensis]